MLFDGETVDLHGGGRKGMFDDIKRFGKECASVINTATAKTAYRVFVSCFLFLRRWDQLLNVTSRIFRAWASTSGESYKGS